MPNALLQAAINAARSIVSIEARVKGSGHARPRDRIRGVLLDAPDQTILFDKAKPDGARWEVSSNVFLGPSKVGHADVRGDQGSQHPNVETHAAGTVIAIAQVVPVRFAW